MEFTIKNFPNEGSPICMLNITFFTKFSPEEQLSLKILKKIVILMLWRYTIQSFYMNLTHRKINIISTIFYCTSRLQQEPTIIDYIE